jgi:hypothetical protein
MIREFSAWVILPPPARAREGRKEAGGDETQEHEHRRNVHNLSYHPSLF